VVWSVQVKALHIHHELMSVENGLLTPTFKAKRTDVEKAFKTHIRQMYAEIAKLPSK
jgi:long-chain acyl-CoA synthetase